MVLTAACFMATTALYLVASEIGGRAPRVSRSSFSRLLSMAAVLLMAYALWWPAQASQVNPTFGASHGVHALLAWSACFALPAFGWLAANRIARRACFQALQAVVASLLAAYVLAMVQMPGLFRMATIDGQLAIGVSVSLLGAAAITAHMNLTNAARMRALRVLSALVVGGVGVFASLAQPAAASTQSIRWSDLIDLAMVFALTWTLMAIMRAKVRSAEPVAAASPAAAIDNLTSLPTRLFFEERMRAEAKRSDARGGAPFAVLFIDLDGFKPVNDTFGHNCGDQVLRLVGKRLAWLTRKTYDAARVGGDEFLLLVPNASSPEMAQKVAQRVIDTLGKPYKVDGREINIACSIGIALHEGGNSAVDKLIARADVAMYAAKRAGGSRHCFYAPDMDMDAQQNFDLVRDLRKAVAKNELELHFQPKMDAVTGKVTAVEALLRWQHPTLGLVLPDRFIPLAERNGLMGPLGNWVIEAACLQARLWRDKGLRMRVAINLSAHQMRQDDLSDRIADALKRHRIHPSLLTCEITETATMEDTGKTQETFRRLGVLGAHLSIDDFGTGYSSLAYLRKLPAKELKIDRSFVMDLEHSADARAVIDAVLKLAHALGLKVVAEGVENQRQQQILTALGCDELQGFLFAKPMTARALLLWAMAEGDPTASFNASLFGSTREGSRNTAVTSFQATLEE
jgi:diguanylate cyclase (GGDEF)-like protein